MSILKITSAYATGLKSQVYKDKYQQFWQNNSETRVYQLLSRFKKQNHSKIFLKIWKVDYVDFYKSLSRLFSENSI